MFCNVNIIIIPEKGTCYCISLHPYSLQVMMAAIGLLQ